MPHFHAETNELIVYSRRSRSALWLACLVLAPVACAPRSDVAEDRALARVEQFGGRIARDSKRDDNPVVKVDLAETPVSDADLNELRSLPQLSHLVLRKTRVTDAGLPLVAATGKLRNLELDHTSITDSGLAHIGQLASLRDLRLAGTRLTDDGLAHLRSLSKLWILDLQGTNISDAGLDHLCELTSLRNLDLRGTQVTPAGFNKLRAALPRVQISYLPGSSTVR
jgi:hypothetical protein